LFVLYSAAYAGPEKFDHLDAFKNTTVKLDGPSEELVKDNSGKEIARASYKYNEKKQIIEIDFFKDAANDGKNLFIYDEKGLKQEELYDKNNHLVEKVIYVRNNANQVTQFEVFDGNNKSLLLWKFQYNNNRVASGSRYIDNALTERFIYEYSGQSIIQHLYFDDNSIAGSVVTDIKNARVIKRTKKEPAGARKIEYYYDSAGRIEKMIFFSEEESRSKIEKIHLFNYTLPLVFQPIKLTKH